MALLLAVSAHAAEWKLQLLGLGTAFDAIAMGRNGGHVLFHKGDPYGGNAKYFDGQIGPDGRITHEEKLPFFIQSPLAFAVGPQLQPHLLFLGSTSLEYATAVNRKWVTFDVPNPGCEMFDSIAGIGSFAVDDADHVYIPCVWEQPFQSSAPYQTYVASLIVFDGSKWTREDAATNRFDSTSQIELFPEGPAYAALDGNGMVHLGYGLASPYVDEMPDAQDICETIRKQPNSYVENCYDTGSDYSGFSSMVIGSAGDAYFFFGNGDSTNYLHFDGSSWTSEPVDINEHLYNLAVDSNGIPSTTFIQTNSETLDYASLTPSGWQSVQVVGALSFEFDTQIALNSAGLPYIAATADNPGTSPNVHEGFYAFVSAPDLTANWNDIAMSMKGKPKLIAHLLVLNDGNAIGRRYNITCFLSKTATATSSDPVLGTATVTLSPGASRIITFDFDPARAPTGQYVVAQIQTQIGEANSNNNTAAIQIP